MENKLPAGVYIHLPFCSVHCTYCDFPITTRLSLSDRYYSALLNELSRNPVISPIDTLYFGGGTPSLAPMELLQAVVARCPLEPDAEITLEVNPDHVTWEKLVAWRELGINRLSLGIQSLQDAVLRSMLRQHTPEQAIQSIADANEAGFQNRGVDLILGYPQQTPEGFEEDLKRLVEIRPEHFSIYLLEIHERTPLARMIESKRLSAMPEDEQIQCYEAAIERLNKAGYLHYEVSNFALEGKTSRHNRKYWTDAPYYAYGAGACSYVGSIRSRNLSDVATYIHAMESGNSPVEEQTAEGPETHARNALIFGLRQIQGVAIPAFEEKFGMHPASLFDRKFEEYLDDGLLEVSQNHLRLTRKGLLLSNEVLSSAIG